MCNIFVVNFNLFPKYDFLYIHLTYCCRNFFINFIIYIIIIIIFRFIIIFLYISNYITILCQIPILYSINMRSLFRWLNYVEKMKELLIRLEWI